MEDNFEFLINNLFGNLKSVLKENINQETWCKCLEIVSDFGNDCDYFVIFQEYYVDQYTRYLNLVFDNFWSKYEEIFDKKIANSCHHRCVFLLADNLNVLVSDWTKNELIDQLFSEKLDNSKVHFVKNLHDILYTIFSADMPLIFNSFLLETFSFSFKLFDSLINNEKKLLIQEQSLNQEDLSLCCENDAKSFQAFLNILRGLGIFNVLCDDIIRSVVYTSIEKHIYTLCKGKNFDVSCLDSILSWFEQSIIGWIKVVYSNEIENKSDSSVGTDLNNDVFDKIELLSFSNIRNFIINTYIFCRMNQLFEIIIDYPYSEAVLYDLQECIKIDPFYRDKFIQSLKSSFETRLLHPGVSTSDIIEAYITAIKALKVLDPQGIILQIVCDPIRNYLKSRDDTVRRIITSLTNDNIVELREPNDDIGVKEDDDEIVLENWKLWIPQPIGVSKLNKDVLHSDIITNLVNIFDTKDLFVQEYQRLLAQRLLSNFEVDMEMEHRNLELLSLRFGESEFHNCEVMLKDIKDSERVNQRINCGEIDNIKVSKHFATNGYILSEQFWPENLSISNSFNDLKNLKLPKQVQEAFDFYTKAFETVKANRTLNWIHQLGSVKIELDFENGQPAMEFTVKPIQAVIIFQFQTKKLWRVSELSEELSLMPSQLRRHFNYWKNLGILTELSHDTYLLDEDGHQKQNSQTDMNISQEYDTFEVDEENKVNKQEENKLQIFWNFIDNMLKNLQALTLDRIFNMLKMFNMQSPEIESLTMHELRQFLDAKVLEGKLVYSNGLYNINTE